MTTPTTDEQLPELPKGFHDYASGHLMFTAYQMRTYAREAIAAVVAERDALRADADMMDFLERHYCEVRIPTCYGSKLLFHAKQISDGGEQLKTDIRAAIDAAMKGQQS